MDLEQQESDQHKEEKKLCELQVSLTSDPPEVGAIINPDVNLTCSHHQSSLHFKWYRLLLNQEAYCCVHKLKKATLQCTTCVSLGIPLSHSFFCSSKCYTDNWNSHRFTHFQPKDEFKVKETAGGKYGSTLIEDFLPNKDVVMVGQDGKTWLNVGSSKIYVPSSDDFGCILRLDTLVVGCPSLSTPHSLVTKCLPQTPRCMIKVEPQVGSRSSVHPHANATFRVLSYNILAQMYVRPQALSHCPEWALTWEFRRENLLREIIGYEADILCLQEVQNDHFEDFFKPKLEQHGYSVRYKGKTRGVFNGSRDIVDGCAICFRSNRFRAVEEHELVFQKIAVNMLSELQPSQKEEGCRRLLKDTLAIITILEPVEYHAASDHLNSRVCVANVHIHSSDKFKDVKLWQVATLVNELETICKTNIPVLLCGDLNSLPGSAPHALVLRGKVDPMHVEFPNDPIGIFDKLKLSHDLRLVSAYSTLLVTRGGDPFLEKQREMMNSATCEPQFTNFSKDFSGTIDYIFYSEDTLELKGVLELLDGEDIANIALPTPKWSSDHVALVGEFCLKRQSQVGKYPVQRC